MLNAIHHGSYVARLLFWAVNFRPIMIYSGGFIYIYTDIHIYNHFHSYYTNINDKYLHTVSFPIAGDDRRN